MTATLHLHAQGEAHALYSARVFVEGPADGYADVRAHLRALDEFPGVFLEETPLGTEVQVPGNLVGYGDVLDRLDTICARAGSPDLIRPRLDGFARTTAYRRANRGLHDLPRNANLRGYQREAVDRLVDSSGFILGDTMGLGKTRTVLSAAYRVMTEGNRPLVVLGPKSVGPEWRAEAVRIGFCAEEETYLCETRSPFEQEMPPFVRLIYCHYDVVQAWWPRLYSYRPKVAALDEAHTIRNTKTNRYRGASLVTRSCDYAWLMSGTPLLNRLAEYHTLLDLACGRWSFGGSGDFRIRYCGAIPTEIGRGLEDQEPTNVEELHARTRHVYLRRTWDDVDAVDVPAIDRQVVDATMSTAKRRRYDRYASELDMDKLLLALERGTLGRETIKILTKLRKTTSTAKIPSTLSLVDDLIEQNVPTVIFCSFRKTAEALEKRIADKDRALAFRVHGGTSMKQRAMLLELFRLRSQECSSDRLAVSDTREVPFLVTTYGVFSAGVNLQDAHGLVLHDLDYVPANMMQAEGRVWRTGQQRQVVSRWMVSMDTLDEMIVRLLERKGRLVGTFLRDEATAQAMASLGEPLEEVDLDRMAESVAALQARRQNRYEN